MEGPLDTGVVSPVLIGRDRELAALDLLIDRVRAGEGGNLLLSGEAGIGKSRLISEARRRFYGPEPSSGLVLQGNCFEVDREYPLAPLADLLERFALRHPGQARNIVGPDLSALVPDLGNTPPGQALPEKRRLHQSFSSLLVRLARDQPLLVVIEDLHWGDELTLELLPHLCRTAGEHPVLMLLSYRDDLLNPALRRMLAALDRERLSTEFVLQPLQRREIDLLLRAVFSQPHPIRPDFLDTIYALTDGNPFFIEEVLRALIAAGDIYFAEGHWQRKEASELRIPRSVRDAVLGRAGDLSPASREVLSLAAVIGRHFGFRVIQELTGMDEQALLSCMRELVQSQLIYEESVDEFAFRHALTREAVYSEMLLRERQRLHRAVAEAIERLEAGSIDSRLADLSYHYAAAGIWEKSYGFAVQAGDRAQALFAPRAAMDHFSRALNAAEQLSTPPEPALYLKRGMARKTLGQFDEARHDFETLLDIVHATGDRALEREALLSLGELCTGYDYQQAGAYFQQAFDLACEIDDRGAIAWSLLKLGNWQVNVERTADAENSLASALGIFEELDDRRGRAEAVDLLGVVADASGDVATMLRRYEQATELYRALGDRQGVASTRANVTVMAGAYNLFETISLAGGIPAVEAEAAGHQVIRLTREIDWRSGEAYVLALLGLHYGAQGRYDLAFDSGRQSLRVADEIQHQEWRTTGLFVIGSLYSDLLDHRRAREFFDECAVAARDSGSLWMQRLTTGFQAASRVREGEFDEADALLHEVRDDFPMHTMGLRMMWLARARLALALGDTKHALEIVDRLFATARNLSVEADIPALAKLRADCLIAAERFEEADTPLISALAGAETYVLRPLLWRVHLTRGNLYRILGRDDEASAEFAVAREIIDAVATSVPVDALRESFLARARSLMPAARRESTRLTPRERDVVGLLARGMSNREIAEALFIGERTVETHVGNILGKLGFNSRAQVVAWMAESAAGDPAAQGLTQFAPKRLSS